MASTQVTLEIVQVRVQLRVEKNHLAPRAPAWEWQDKHSHRGGIQTAGQGCLLPRLRLQKPMPVAAGPSWVGWVTLKASKCCQDSAGSSHSKRTQNLGVKLTPGMSVVKDKEDTQVDSEARPMKDETFGEYR